MSRSNIINHVLVILIALASLTGYLKKDGSDNNLAKARNLLDNRQYRRANAEIDSQIASNPNNSSVYLQAISCLSRSGRIKDAIRVGEQFYIRLESSHLERHFLPVEKAAFYIQMGDFYYDINKTSGCEHYYRLALALLPDDPRILNELGYIYADNGIKLDQALKLLHRAVYLCPNDPMIVDSLGWAQYKHGDYKSAIDNLRYAVSLAPDNPDLRYHLGAAFLKNRQYLRAKIELSKALSLGAHATDVSKLMNNIHT